jgi:SAM-dependent methyltransferase
MSQWPKMLPPLTAEQKRISDDFMEHWHEVFAQRYGFIDNFNHRYVVKNSPCDFLTTLEIGSGLGEHLEYEQLSPEQERNYVALDIRENMMHSLVKRFPSIQMRVSDCQDRQDFPDGYFDRIVAVHVLEHLPNLPATIREMHRLCDKAHGVFLVVIPCEGSLATAIARRISAKRIFEKRYGQPYDWFIQREHINRPKEIFAELVPHFEVMHHAFFPIPIPLLFCNLFVGLTLKPKRWQDASGGTLAPGTGGRFQCRMKSE